MNTYKLNSVNDEIVGKYCEQLESKSRSNYTYNAKVKALRTFFNYLIDEEEHAIRNPWKKVKLKSEKPTDISITAQDFYDLIEIVNPENAIMEVGKTTRNMYRDWLRNVFKLKAYSGRRNAELFAMKWNMIVFEDDKPMYIECPNIKVNKLRNNIEEADFQYSFVPIGEELLELLIDLNYDENKDSDEYIIAPGEKNRRNLEVQTSRYFTYFFKKLGRDYNRQLKHLRQTYITKEDLFVNSRISMQHSNYKTTSKHYIDKSEIAKQMVKNGFRVFPKKGHSKGTPVGHSRNKKRATSL